MTDRAGPATRAPESQPAGMFWPTQDPPPEVRGLTLGAIAMTGLPALALVALDGVGSPGTVGALAVIGVSLVLSVGLVRHGLRPLPRPVIVGFLTLAAVALIAAFVLARQPITVLATSGPFGLGVAWFRPRWVAALVGLGAIGAAALSYGLVYGERASASTLIQMGIFGGASLISFAGASIDWQVKRRMDRHHADQNELSLARERLRFATDLHDIQGHTLLAIKLKAELARRSMDRDPRRARRELQDIEELAAQAGDQTRELAQGYRSLTLAAELANLDQLLGAAGIRVHIDRRGAPAPEHEELFAACVREAASNILRHADARAVGIELTPTRVTIRNDGAATTAATADPRPVGGGSVGGSGLSGLRQRFQGGGGTFAWRHEGEHFTVTGTIGEHP